MKKLSALLLSSGFIIPSFAFSYSNFDGFFAGISGGATQTQMTLDRQVDVNYTFLIFNEEFHSASSAKLYRETPFGEIDFGYGHAFPNIPLYLGADIFGNLSQRKVTARPGNTFVEKPGEIITGNVNQRTRTTLQLNDFEYGFDLKPGIELSPFSLLYARVGAAFNKLRMKTIGSFTLIDDTFTQSEVITPLIASSSKNVVGLRLGVGMNQLLTSNLALSADYIYTDYGDIGTLGIVNTNNILVPSTPGGYRSQLDASLATQTIMLGLNYYFDPNTGKNNPFPTEYVNCFFNGPYIGIAGGAIQNTVDRTINYEAHYMLSALPEHSITLSKDAQHYTNSGIGEIFVGYGHLLDISHVYLGAEAFLDVADHAVSTTNSNIIRIAVPPDSTINKLLTTTKTDMNSVEIGADLKPGWVFNDRTLLFGRVGMVFNKLEISSNNQFVFENNFAPTQPPLLVSSLHLNPSKNVVGLRLGMGVEEAITRHWSANFNYIYTAYGKISANGTGDARSVGIDTTTGLPFIATTPNGLVSNVTAKIATQTEMFGVSYHF